MCRSNRQCILLCILTLGFAASARDANAQSGSADSSGDKISKACSEDVYRQFDYWLGRWTVNDSTGKQVGTSHVIRVSDGCAVLEQWKDAAGNAGTSINMYDAATRTWEQHWMGAGAGLLHLTGKLEGGAMTLSGKRNTPNGPVTDRVRWIPMDGGRVRQLWTMSNDDGKTWTTAFNGIYSPATSGS